MGTLARKGFIKKIKIKLMFKIFNQANQPRLYRCIHLFNHHVLKATIFITLINTKFMHNMYHSIVKVAAFKTTQKFQNAFRCLSYLTFLSELGAMDQTCKFQKMDSTINAWLVISDVRNMHLLFRILMISANHQFLFGMTS